MDHQRGWVYGNPRPDTAAPVVGRYQWSTTGSGKAVPARPPSGISPARVPLTAGQARAVRRRWWMRRLLLSGWMGLASAALVVGWRWFGPVSVCCPLLMAAVLLVLAWCAATDVRTYVGELRDGG